MLQDIKPQDLTKEQSDLVGRGCAGPPVDLDGVALTDEQVRIPRLLTLERC